MFKKNVSNTNIESSKVGKDLNFAATEAYNLLKTNISFSLNSKGEKIKVIGITSSAPQEGKSYTSINLSYTLAKDGHKTLLIDSDMRKPSVAKYLEMNLSPGLSNLLVDKSFDLEATINKGVLDDNLDIIFSGNIPPNPSNLVSSENMGNLINNLKEKYEYIIVDLPPVNSVSDALAISKYIDGTIIVVKHNYTRKKDLFEAIRQLNFVNAQILGLIYNGYHADNSPYYRRYYYQSNKKIIINI